MELYKKHISNLGRIVTGKTPKTSIPENYGGQTPFLTPSDDLSGKYVPLTTKTLSVLGLNEVKNCLLPSKSVCISCIGSDLGKVVITKEPTVTNQQFNSIVPNNENDTDFIYYLLTIVGKHLNILSKTSTAVPIINKSTFSNYEIELPNLENQRRIARVLSSLDDKIECNTRINANLEAQAQALFDKLIMDIKLPRNTLLSDYMLVNPPRSLAKGKKARYIDMSSLPTKGSFPTDWTFSNYNGGMKFQNGDTIMARITPCLENGKTAFINFLSDEEIAFGSTEYIVLTAIDNIYSELCYFLARNNEFVSYATSHMNGSSGRQRVSAKDIANFAMPEIPKERIKYIGSKFKTIMNVIKNNSLESRRLAELRDALLPRLMSGELKVDDVKL